MRLVFRPRPAQWLGSLLTAFLLLAVPGAARAQQPAAPDIGGIYLVGQKYFVPPKIWKYGNGQFKPAIRKAGVDGVLIDPTWSDVAPGYRKYDWSLLDYMARVAIEQGKKFEIAIITGSSTPGWVFADPPNGYGAQSATFDYIQSTKPGATCAAQVLPLPWDARYLAASGDLLDRLSRHLQKKGYYPDLTMLRITGINTLTDELRLPAQTPETTGNYTSANKCTVNNLQLWQSFGYRPQLVRQAWRHMLRQYRRAFPDKAFNVALITSDGFPASTADGVPVVAPPATMQRLTDAMTTSLVKEAARELPGRFIVQSNGLIGNQPPDPATIVDARKAGAMLAWQTNEWNLTSGGAACAGTRAKPIACTAATFAAMLTRGIFPYGTAVQRPLQAQYLEIFAPNILAFPHIVLHAHDLLLASGAMPAPTNLARSTIK
ncbi:MAG: hypothetical protein ACREE2_16160 [Stellaceae bacterium]